MTCRLGVAGAGKQSRAGGAGASEPGAVNMRRSSTWIYLVVGSVALCAIEILVFLRYGPFTLDASKRWQGLLWFAPFLVLLVSIDFGFLAAAANARPGLDRTIKKGILVVYTIALVVMTVAVSWFVLVPK